MDTERCNDGLLIGIEIPNSRNNLAIPEACSTPSTCRTLFCFMFNMLSSDPPLGEILFMSIMTSKVSCSSGEYFVDRFTHSNRMNQCSTRGCPKRQSQRTFGISWPFWELRIRSTLISEPERRSIGISTNPGMNKSSSDGRRPSTLNSPQRATCSARSSKDLNFECFTSNYFNLMGEHLALRLGPAKKDPEDETVAGFERHNV